MGDLAEKLERVALFLEWVGGIGFADDLKFLGDDFPFLTLALRGNQFAVDDDRGAGMRPCDRTVIGQRGIDDDLDALEAGAVVELYKRKGFGVAASANPTLEKNGVEGFGAGEGVFDEGAWHGILQRVGFCRVQGGGEAKELCPGLYVLGLAEKGGLDLVGE
jgi:hypothetical protein